MSDLTLEKMDKINFLITEVSLECLGNGFFDIYGEKCPSLLGLISANTLRPKPTNLDNESDLASALAIDSIPSNNLNQTSKSDETHDRKKKKRRASCSIEINNEMDVSADPESLLVPMAYIPKAAKIANRRSTIAVQRKLTTFISPPKPQPPKSIEEIKQNLRHDINARYVAMRLLSQSQEERYRTLNSNPNMNDFFKSEKSKLFAQCNTLIKFIKFIQEDTYNAPKLQQISEAILQLQAEY